MKNSTGEAVVNEAVDKDLRGRFTDLDTITRRESLERLYLDVCRGQQEWAFGQLCRDLLDVMKEEGMLAHCLPQLFVPVAVSASEAC